jgi:hypothetical protein
MLYVYALTDRNVESTETIDCGGIFAVIREVKRAPQISESAMRRHDREVRRIAAGAGAILPMRFGSVAADGTALARMVGERRAELSLGLARVAGCVQMTLRVFGSRVASTRRSARVMEVKGGAEYLARRRAALAREASAAEIAPVLEAVAPLIRGQIVERHEVLGLVASVYHLVKGERVGAYDAAFGGAAPAIAPFRVAKSGPWPPYAFAAEVFS